MLNEILRSISLLAETARFGAEEAARKAKPYARLYLKGLIYIAIIGIVVPITCIVIGIINDWRWLIAFAGIWSAAWILLLLLVASPIGVVIEVLTSGFEGSGQRYIKRISSISLVLLCISLYGATVPLEEDISKLPLVIVASIILGILNTWVFSRKVIGFIVTVVFIILTLSFFFPTTFHTLQYKIKDLDVSSNELQRLNITYDSIRKGEVRFFRSDGTPRVWYYQYPDGEMDFFDRYGRHPINNTELKPVTPEIVKLYQKGAQEKQAQIDSQTIELEKLRIEKEEAELIRRKQIEYEKKLKEASRKKQAIQEFEKLISQAELTDNWEAKDVWKRNIKDKYILVNYTEARKMIAATIFSRFQKLGAKVDFKLVSDVSAVNLSGNLYYTFDDLGAATAIQAAVIDILRIKMNSIGHLGNITLWVG